MRGATCGVALAVAVLACVPACAAAQAPAAPRRPQLEARADLIAARATAVQGALGLVVPLGTYARASAVGGGGTTALGGETRGSARADAVVRFLFDPFLERRWGPYGGAGVSALYTAAAHDRGGGWRGYLLAVAGIEGPPAHGVLPALELGLGGGTRVGVVLRGARREGR
jgi:hypothetical protein